jgi:hypothetical protein
MSYAIAVLAAVVGLAGDDPTIVEQLQAEAKALQSTVETPLARAFLDATAKLPPGEARVVFRERGKTCYTEEEAMQLPEAEHAALERLEIDDGTYYTTKYGSPLAYVRTLEIDGKAGLESVEGKRVADFGYGTVGHLRLLAGLGADARGVDVDPFLRALYSQRQDQGPLGKGRVTLVDGHWPGTTAVRTEIGDGIRLFTSKNTLKRGYIHPEREVDPRRLVHLGVSDEEFCRAVYESLEPGGLFVIYNLSPAQNPPDKPYKPWADGRCPFERELLEKIGFEIVAFDVEDHGAARSMARALRWHEGENGMDPERDLFAHYTVMRKP